MRWAFVSREAYEERGRVVASAHAEISRLRTRLDVALDELWAERHPLKQHLDGSASRPLRDGGHESVMPTHAPVDPIRDVIREQVRANANMPGLGAYLSNYARHLRDDRNMNPAEIERALRTWESSESLSEPVESIVPVDGVASDESDEAAA